MIKFRLCKETDLTEGEMKVFLVEGKDLLLVKIKGVFRCVENACPHRSAPLSDGILEGSVLTCPYHAAQFDLANGKVSFNVPIPALKMFQVIVEEGNVLVVL